MTFFTFLGPVPEDTDLCSLQQGNHNNLNSFRLITLKQEKNYKNLLWTEGSSHFWLLCHCAVLYSIDFILR